MMLVQFGHAVEDGAFHAGIPSVAPILVPATGKLAVNHFALASAYEENAAWVPISVRTLLLRRAWL
jgi:hypothetical protein